MKITPLEIRQKVFEKKLRGYDKDEVNAFLQSLSQEWERIQDENKELRINLEASRKEVEKLREVESSLFKTLKTAEDTGANMIEQANKTAELHLKETQMKADALLNEAKSRAKTMQEQADYQAQRTLDEMENELRELYQSFKALESHRDSLISDLRNLNNDSLEKVKKIASKTDTVNLDKLLKRSLDTNRFQSYDDTSSAAGSPSEAQNKVKEEHFEEKKKKDKDKEKKKEVVPEKSTGSFFDEIG